MGTLKGKGALGRSGTHGREQNATHTSVMREALGHDADVLSNRAQLSGLVALGRATEAQSLGLASHTATSRPGRPSAEGHHHRCFSTPPTSP